MFSPFVLLLLLKQQIYIDLTMAYLYQKVNIKVDNKIKIDARTVVLASIKK
jgi:hypothetical protein